MTSSPYTDRKFVLRTFEKLGWVVWALAMSATTGSSWIGDTDGAIEHFGVRDHLAYSSACEREILTSGWCSTFQGFVILQTTAALLCSMAMVGLIVSGGRGDSPGAISMTGCTFLIYASAQLTAAGLVVALKSEYDKAFRPRPRQSWSSSSWYVLDIRYGVSFWAAVAAATLGLFEAGVLLAKARSCAGGRARHRLARDDGTAHDDDEEAAAPVAASTSSCFFPRNEGSRPIPP